LVFGNLVFLLVQKCSIGNWFNYTKLSRQTWNEQNFKADFDYFLSKTCKVIFLVYSICTDTDHIGLFNFLPATIVFKLETSVLMHFFMVLRRLRISFADTIFPDLNYKLIKNWVFFNEFSFNSKPIIFTV
jgi:hypothetical protein